MAAASPNAPACPTLQMLMVAVNKQRELKSQACFKAGQEGATCEGPAEMHCVWCGVLELVLRCDRVWLVLHALFRADVWGWFGVRAPGEVCSVWYRVCLHVHCAVCSLTGQSCWSGE